MDIARLIDSTLLKPEATPEDIDRLCADAKEYRFMTVCVAPCYIRHASELLRGTGVKVCSVAGFPLGNNVTKAKCYEAELAVTDGAAEIDIVMNVGALKAGNYNAAEQDISAVKRSLGEKALLKVILENCLLTGDEITTASKICVSAGADFVKTSTGLNLFGAKAEHVRLMRAAVGDACGVKAAGGIRTLEQLLEMAEAGANRIGTSNGAGIMKEFLNKR